MRFNRVVSFKTISRLLARVSDSERSGVHVSLHLPSRTALGCRATNLEQASVGGLCPALMMAEAPIVLVSLLQAPPRPLAD